MAEGVPGAVEEVTFALSGGVTTHGQLDYPGSEASPYPTVLLIQESGPIDRHETFIEPDGTVRRPFDLIAEALTRRGLAVFRYDKRGVCPPSQVCDAAAYGAQSKPVLTEDAALAYARMIANPLIDATRTAVLGHSEGTWLTPALPNRFPHPGAGLHQHGDRRDARPELHAGHAPPGSASRPMIPTTTALSLRMKCPSPTPSR